MRNILEIGATGLKLVEVVNNNDEQLFGQRINIIGVNVLDYAATGNGVTNDTAAIQSAIDATPTGGYLYFPAGVYMIAATGTDTTGANGGLNITRNMTVVIELGAVLKAIPAEKTYAQIMHVVGVSKFELYGGNFFGDKALRVTPKENCLGLLIEDSSNIYIHNTVFSQFAGDGVRVARKNADSKNVLIANADFDNFSRWGISADVSRNLIISNCKFKDGNGEFIFGGGIDIEYEYNLDASTTVMRNIFIKECDFQNIGTGTNQKTGIIVINPTDAKNYENVIIQSVTMSECARGINFFNTKNFKVLESSLDAGGYTLTVHCSPNGWNYGLISGNSFLNNSMLNVGDSALQTDYTNGLIIANNTFDNSYIRFNFGTSNNCMLLGNNFRNLGAKIPIDVVSGHTANGLYKANNMNIDTGLIIN